MGTTLNNMSSRILSTALVAGLLLLGCGRSTPVADAVVPGVERIVNEVTITTGEPVTMADLSIEGMSCEMMCGGSIKKALAALGVNATEIRMSEVEGPDHAIVTYDESKVSDAQMVAAIQELYDGQYKVLAITITKEVKGAAASNSEAGEEAENKGVSVAIPEEVVLPSILAILSRILSE